MVNKYKKLLDLAFLIIFLSLILFINFFHTDKTLTCNNSCPACHFLNSAFATSQIDFFHLPQLSLLEIIQTFESFHYIQISITNPLSRSPELGKGVAVGEMWVGGNWLSPMHNAWRKRHRGSYHRGRRGPASKPQR